MRKSSSLNWISGDNPLPLWKKGIFFALNGMDNSTALVGVDPRMRMGKFSVGQMPGDRSRDFLPSSPCRVLSDLFWQSLCWEKIAQALGGIHIFDTGCGSGNYYLKLHEYSAGRILSYRGVDVKAADTWPRLQKAPQCTLKIFDGKNILPHIPPIANFIMTQSAIEHFESDIAFFEQIKAFSDRTTRPLLQIHLCPAARSLSLYGCHGYRQYHPRSISRLLKDFFDDGQVRVYPLGGARCFALHKDFLAGSDPARYRTQFFEAFHSDFLNDTHAEPIFYAVVIAIRWTDQIEQVLQS